MIRRHRALCLVPSCVGFAHARGLCVNCYQLAARMVRQKETTWAKLQSNEKVRQSRLDETTEKRAWILGRLDPENPRKL